MRIVSKQRDYYDSVQAYGQDQANVYVRKEVEIELFYNDIINLKLEQLLNDAYFRWSHNVPREMELQYYIGFCGKLYPVFHMTTSWTTGDYDGKLKEAWVYDSAGIEGFFKDAKMKKELEFYLSKERKRRTWQTTSDFKRKPIEEFIKSFDNENYEYLFHRLKTPIFVLKPQNSLRAYMSSTSDTTLHATLIKDAILEPYRFYKVFDVYQAFQNVSFYIEGVLGITAPVMATVPDEYLLEAKGFDKWSFKKLPGKRKKKRRK